MKETLFKLFDLAVTMVIIGVHLLMDLFWSFGKCLVVMVLTLLLLRWVGCIGVVQAP